MADFKKIREALESGGRGFSQGATLGFGDEAVAAMLADKQRLDNRLPETVGPYDIARPGVIDKFSTDYIQARDAERAANAAAAERNPLPYGAGIAAGGGMLAPATAAQAAGIAAGQSIGAAEKLSPEEMAMAGGSAVMSRIPAFGNIMRIVVPKSKNPPKKAMTDSDRYKDARWKEVTKILRQDAKPNTDPDAPFFDYMRNNPDLNMDDALQMRHALKDYGRSGYEKYQMVEGNPEQAKRAYMPLDLKELNKDVESIDAAIRHGADYTGPMYRWQKAVKPGEEGISIDDLLKNNEFTHDAVTSWTKNPNPQGNFADYGNVRFVLDKPKLPAYDIGASAKYNEQEVLRGAGGDFRKIKQQLSGLKNKRGEDIWDIYLEESPKKK